MLKDIALDVAKNIASLGLFEEILVEQETDSTKFTAYPETLIVNCGYFSGCLCASNNVSCSIIFSFLIGSTNSGSF